MKQVTIYRLAKSVKALEGMTVQFHEARLLSNKQLSECQSIGEERYIVYNEPVHVIVDEDGERHYVAMEPKLADLLSLPMRAPLERAQAEAQKAREIAWASQRERSEIAARVEAFNRSPFWVRIWVALQGNGI